MVAAGAGALILPLFMRGFTLRFATDLYMYACLACGWNLIGGLCGYGAFGNVAFLGLGAYTTAVLMSRAALPVLLTLPVAGAVAAAFAALFGYPVLRLKGHYFAIATLGLAEVTREVVANLRFLGGGQGISLPLGGEGPAFFYYLMLGLLSVSVALTYGVLRSRVGYAFVAIREDEMAAEAAGVNTAAYKVLAFSLSAFLCGMAGGAYAYWMSYIEPPMVFDVAFSVTMLVMPMIGGAGTLWGPVLGAFILRSLTQVLWGEFLTLHLLLLGLVMIGVVLFLPRGLMQYLTGERRLSWAAVMENISVHRV